MEKLVTQPRSPAVTAAVVLAVTVGGLSAAHLWGLLVLAAGLHAVFAPAVLASTTMFAVLDLVAAALIPTLTLMPSNSRSWSGHRQVAR